jgi:hypothetical protein
VPSLGELAELVDLAARSEWPSDFLRAYIEAAGLHDEQRTDLLGRRARRVWEVLETHRLGRSKPGGVRQQLQAATAEWRASGEA